jgi:3-oxoacyl-ACP reductase-like protein
MKPLILMLLFVIAVEAQSLPEVAQKERVRQAKVKSVHVYTNEDAKTAPTRPESTTAAAPAQATAPSAPAAAPAPAAKPAEIVIVPNDRVRKYNEDLARLRARAVQLGDQSTTLQLQLVDLKNQFLAPVTDTITRSQTQTRIEQVQQQLVATENQLVETRRSIQVMEALGPPKP